MPTINRKPVQVVSLTRENKKRRMELYNLQSWRNLRRIYLQEHPLCEKCLENGTVTGEHLSVHHKLSPFDPSIDEMERYRRLLDYSNLQTLCLECHAKAHNEKKKSHKT